MLLAIDIGNTHIVSGLIRDGTVQFEARLATDPRRTADQYWLDLKSLLSAYNVRPDEVTDCIISSVVPPVCSEVCRGAARVVGKRPLIVAPGLKTGLNIQADMPSQVGSDRIVAVVAALERYEPPLILIDMGTATTIEVVTEGNHYIGGCIIPGVGVSLEAVTAQTAQLPGIQLGKPGRVIGKNTEESMRSGVMYGAAAMLDGMIERIEDELGRPASAVATGGIARLIVPLCRRQIVLDNDLLLNGLYILYQKNRKK